MRPTVQNLLATLGVPAYVVTRRLDILGWNRLATAVFEDWAQLPTEEGNVARRIFLSSEAHDRFAEPDHMAAKVAGVLRRNAGKSPEDAHLTSLIRELSQQSEEFRRLWARHEVGCGSVGEVMRMCTRWWESSTSCTSPWRCRGRPHAAEDLPRRAGLPVGGSLADAGQLGDGSAGLRSGQGDDAADRGPGAAGGCRAWPRG
ncbi:MmyB family transcriptional regulator [Streptomyces hawaiiensis]|uniref:MmyB family transcriptional regulator n=1 Tax=Streptomyces hawaiiensis TaxID=67305 RepID=UPI003668B939